MHKIWVNHKWYTFFIHRTFQHDVKIYTWSYFTEHEKDFPLYLCQIWQYSYYRISGPWWRLKLTAGALGAGFRSMWATSGLLQRIPGFPKSPYPFCKRAILWGYCPPLLLLGRHWLKPAFVGHVHKWTYVWQTVMELENNHMGIIVGQQNPRKQAIMHNNWDRTRDPFSLFMYRDSNCKGKTVVWPIIFKSEGSGLVKEIFDRDVWLQFSIGYPWLGKISVNKANLRDLIAMTGLVISNELQINVQTVWSWNLTDDLEKQCRTCSML